MPLDPVERDGCMYTNLQVSKGGGLPMGSAREQIGSYAASSSFARAWAKTCVGKAKGLVYPYMLATPSGLGGNSHSPLLE